MASASNGHPSAAARVVARAGDVVVWLADLDGPSDAAADTALLSRDECARADRFVQPLHRRRFVTCRAWLRRVLAAEIGADAPVVFEYGPFGKPALAGEAGAVVSFNVSHSDQYALIAVSKAGAVGVDIERVRPLADLGGVADGVFSEAERVALAALPDDLRLGAFFEAWTRKEAYAKARGRGIAHLADYEVSFLPGEPARLTRVAGEPEEASRWSFVTMTPVAGFAAALCHGAPVP